MAVAAARVSWARPARPRGIIAAGYRWPHLPRLTYRHAVSAGRLVVSRCVPVTALWKLFIAGGDRRRIYPLQRDVLSVMHRALCVCVKHISANAVNCCLCVLASGQKMYLCTVYRHVYYNPVQPEGMMRCCLCVCVFVDGWMRAKSIHTHTCVNNYTHVCMTFSHAKW